MSDEPVHEITELLKAWNNGDSEARDKLVPLVEQELKKIARAYMSKERSGHVLQTTALVNEAFLKLLRENITWANRKQFYALVAKRMRQVLIDYAKKESAAKRGKRPEQVDAAELPDQPSEKSKELLMLDQALTKLAEIDQRKATIVESRFFIGLSFEEIAKVLGTSAATVRREWSFAQAWLKNELTRESNN